MSTMVSKKYTKGAFFEFLHIRHKIWRIQITVFIICCILGFPTTILSSIRQKLVNYEDYPLKQEQINKIDSMIYTIFVLGIFKDERPDVENYFYITMFALWVGLYLERVAINWLTDRRGCNYNKLQKFIELDLRRQSIIDRNWATEHPPYNIENYRHHYFNHDFDDIKKRLVETQEQAEEQGKNKEDKEYRNFVPHKVALRIRDCIRFTVKLEGGSPDMDIDK